jgi:DNA-binding transcriptional MerR regulator
VPDPTPAPDPEEATLGVAAVARRLGVATGTLRTWDRRYGLGPSQHQAGARRRYTARDVARLDLMRRLMLEGVTPAEAARVAASSNVEGHPPGVPAERPSSRPRRGARAGGGRVVPLREASPAARGLARAAMSLDGDACTAMLVASLRRRGVVPTWNEVLLPVLAGVGDRWRSTGSGVEVEHLLSECAEAALRSGTRTHQSPQGVRPVVLAALEPESHRLPVVALSAALAERAVPVRMLGVRLPLKALADAVVRVGPVAVFLWSRGASGPVPLPPLDDLGPVRPRPVVVLGGPGWEAERWRRDVTWVADLDAAVRTLVALTDTGVDGSGGSDGSAAPAR